MYQILIILFSLIGFLIMYQVLYRKYRENLENIGEVDKEKEKGRLDGTDIFTTSTKLPISSNFSSNMAIQNYDERLFVEPNRYDKLDGDRLDERQNAYAGVQPKDMYFDILDINCSQPYKRPWACLLLKGNIVNNIPKRYCRTVCPHRFVNIPEEEMFKVEGFKNFEDPPKPSHYYCYSFCKKGCTKHKYNPLNPEKNSCGQNGFSQVPLPVYKSHVECIRDSFPCDSLGEKECLGNPKCGWCTNGIGEGHCFRSTPEGPFNLKLPCMPSRQKPTNAFKPGRLDPFEGVAQFQPVPKIPK